MLSLALIIEEYKKVKDKTIVVNIVLLCVDDTEVEKISILLGYLQYPVNVFVLDLKLTRTYYVHLFDESSFDRPEAVYVFVRLEEQFTRFLASATKYCFYGSKDLITPSQKKAFQSIHQMKVFTLDKHSWLNQELYTGGLFPKSDAIFEVIDQELFKFFDVKEDCVPLSYAQATSIFFNYFNLFIPCNFEANEKPSPHSDSVFYFPLGLSDHMMKNTLSIALRHLKCLLKELDDLVNCDLTI